MKDKIQIRMEAYDHEALDQRWLRLRPRLTAVAVGRSGFLPLREVEAYCGAYAAHIAKEETSLLPRAKNR